jgi:hypothetical protein
MTVTATEVTPAPRSRPKTAKQLGLELGRQIAGTHNGRSRSNGNGSPAANGRRNGNGNGKLTKAQARRAAVRFGGSMLSAATLETARHSDDVVILAKAIAEQLGIKGAERQDLLAAAKLHDIGKAAIPPRILTKPGSLNAAEWKRMRRHTVIGADILRTVPHLGGIAEMVRHSHERWDGGGYPDGLAGEDIPLGSRVILCADAFHAIRSDRPYRPGRPPRESLREIRRHAGTQFDPAVVEAFEAVVSELRLAPAVPRIRRTKRLTALLLMLAIGGGGSAIAQTDLLGDPWAPGGEPNGEVRALGCGGGACGELLGISLAEAFRGESPARSDAELVGAGAGAFDLPADGGLGLPSGPAPAAGGGPVGTGVLDSDPAAGGRVDVQNAAPRPDPPPAPAAPGGSGGSTATPGPTPPAEGPDKPGSGGKGPWHGGGKGHGSGGGHGHGPGNGPGWGGKPGKGPAGSGGTSGSGGPGGPSGSSGGHGGKGGWGGGSSGGKGSWDGGSSGGKGSWGGGPGSSGSSGGGYGEGGGRGRG